MKSNSRYKRTAHTLVSDLQAEAILVSLANTPDWIDARDPNKYQHTIERQLSRGKGGGPRLFPGFSHEDIRALCHLLRQAWMSRDLRNREWLCFELRRIYAGARHLIKMRDENDGKQIVQDWTQKKTMIEFALGRDPDKDRFTPAQMLYNIMNGEQYTAALKASAPALSEFEAIAFHLQRNLDRALFCPNPECRTPFFFSARKGQVYCSPKCAEYGQRESKKKWWNENRGKSSKGRKT